jgi:hypothetical protein
VAHRNTSFSEAEKEADEFPILELMLKENLPDQGGLHYLNMGEIPKSGRQRGSFAARCLAL